MKQSMAPNIAYTKPNIAFVLFENPSFLFIAFRLQEIARDYEMILIESITSCSCFVIGSLQLGSVSILSVWI